MARFAEAAAAQLASVAEGKRTFPEWRNLWRPVGVETLDRLNSLGDFVDLPLGRFLERLLESASPQLQQLGFARDFAKQLAEPGTLSDEDTTAAILNVAAAIDGSELAGGEFPAVPRFEVKPVPVPVPTPKPTPVPVPAPPDRAVDPVRRKGGGSGLVLVGAGAMLLALIALK